MPHLLLSEVVNFGEIVRFGVEFILHNLFFPFPPTFISLTLPPRLGKIYIVGCIGSSGRSHPPSRIWLEGVSYLHVKHIF